MKRNRKITGLTLIELLLYVALLGVLSNAVFAIFYKADQTNRLLSRRLFDLLEMNQICERLKQDVRSARGLLPPDIKAAGPEEVLVLDCGQSAYITYALENGYLVRKRYEGKVAQRRTFRPRIARLRFSYDAEKPREARLVTVNMELKRHSKIKGRGQVFSIAAALRAKARNTK